MKNELEESWNKFKTKLLAEGIPIRPNDRVYFQSGFNAAVKLFRKPNITTNAADGEGRRLDEKKLLRIAPKIFKECLFGR